MILKCIGSGSNGNSYALISNDGKILLLDLGLPKNKIVKAIDYRVSDIVCAVASHSHGDHCLSVKEFRNMGISVMAPYDKEYWHIGEYGKLPETVTLHDKSDFSIKAFALTNTNGRFMHTNNDGSECPCYGFLIEHPEMGKTLYITDTELVKWKFIGINHILISCNYDKDLIPKDHPAREHIFRGHMELQTVKEFVKANCSNTLRNVILCHLSGDNADLDKMVAEVKQAAGTANVDVAEAGKSLELSLYPF